MTQKIKEELDNWLNDFYIHATGTKDYGCNECIRIRNYIHSLYTQHFLGLLDEELLPIVKHNLWFKGHNAEQLTEAIITSIKKKINDSVDQV